MQVLFDLPGPEKWAKPAQSGQADKQDPWPSDLFTARLGAQGYAGEGREGPPADISVSTAPRTGVRT